MTILYKYCKSVLFIDIKLFIFSNAFSFYVIYKIVIGLNKSKSWFVHIFIII